VCRNTALDLREKNVKFLNVAGIDGFFIDKTEKHNIKDTISDENGGLKQTFSTNSENIEKTIISSNYSNKKSAQEDALGTTPNEAATTECALMYIGIPNFTGITSSNTPHDAFEMLKNQIGILADLTIQEGGEVDKIIGEKMLSVFYKTSDDTNSVSNACNVAIKIKDARQNNILPMNYAIGINYGKVITGFLGAGGKRDHTVIGDAVNTAARIESYAELKAQNSLCLMSEIAAQQLLHDSYKLKKLDAVSLKGKENKIVVYEIC
jgi:adenylate cyclase